jgi:hypothetical protein
MPDIIGRKNLLPNVTDPLQDTASSVALIKQYTVPNTKDYVRDTLQEKKIDVAFLRSELRRLQSKVKRLEHEIESEVTFITAALNGEQESWDQVKRRLSRLKGALEYKGHG